MDDSDIEDTLLCIGEPKLHRGMCKSLRAVYAKVFAIFPDIEATRPRSTSGIQALCALHIALEKTKAILQHCAECSKIYLAITGDSVVMKFEKTRRVLRDSLRRVEDIVPRPIGVQIAEILVDLGKIEFSVNQTEKQIGENIIVLLQQRRNFDSDSNNKSELEYFNEAASKLGINSLKAAVRERRALKKLIENARANEDTRKESIVAYLLHLMRNYSKSFRTEFTDDNDSQGSTPCSPVIQDSFNDGREVGQRCCDFEKKLSKLSSLNFRTNLKKSEQMPVPPEELRCPISLQLMYDPVIIASGQTYERVCIEKWFNDGHITCPKTQQQLPHLSLTPNYCVKGLVASWCEQNGVPVPCAPPESLDLNYWRLMLSERDSANSKLIGTVGSCKFEGINAVPDDSGAIEEAGETKVEAVSALESDVKDDSFEQYENFLAILDKEDDLMEKCKVVERIRHLLKGDEEARIYMGTHGFVEALLQFLESAVSASSGTAQEIGAMALFNLAVNNNRNKESMLESGVLPLLDKMIVNTDSVGAATALYLNISCLDAAKPIIGTSESVPFLISVLKHESNTQCKLDALHTLYNISSHPANIPHLLSSGIIDALQALISRPEDHTWNEKCIAVLIYLASSGTARDEIMKAPGLVNGLATILDVGEPVEQEQAAACLLVLCTANEKFYQIVLQEGVIPSLVSISVNGTARGKQKAQKLLMLFREQRQRDSPPPPVRQRIESTQSNNTVLPASDPKPLSKSISRRTVGKAMSFWWKNKSRSVHQY
ncbi:U-box domain-containing protein 45-like [Dorcoceras hygrometricum]|uniref:RING-type E3 ubiquitin transferase n=1 Tax=Dorcoceras hygrometricum TaxID=472368 RepID=A0A2Z7BZC3_9LAMI|nr:U-box domain-containing protein 45-like [Dorcoceras hygrometricum]